MAAGRAVLAAEVDDLQVQGVPVLGGEQPLAVPFGLRDVLASRQAPAIDQAVDMGVDWEGRHAEVLRHDYLRGLVTDAWELFEGIEVGGDLAAVLVEQYLREIPYGLRFARGQSAGADDLLDCSHLQRDHFLRPVGAFAQRRRNGVYTRVSALGREQDRDEVGIGVAAVEGNGRIGIQALEGAEDDLDLVGLFLRALCFFK